MKLLKILIMIGIFILPNILGYNKIAAKSLFVEALRRHSSNYWFSDKKDIEVCHAIEWDDTNKMGKMLKDGLDINKQGNQGMTFLIYSFLKDKKKSYEFLVEHGADQNIPINAEEKLDNDWSLKGKDTSLTMAAGDAEDPFYLETGLKNGGNPNTVFNDVHILHNAIRVHSFTNVQLLIEAGADVNGLYETNKGGPPLWNAISGSQYDIAYYLLQKGANPDLYKDEITFDIYQYKVRSSLGKDDLEMQKEYKDKVIKILEGRGFDFSPENVKRIKAEKAEKLRKWQEEMKNR